MKRRALLHTKLAFQKNLVVKSRKPCGLCCELTLPPFFFLVLAIPFLSAENEWHQGYDYATPDATIFDLESLVTDLPVFCAKGFSAEAYDIPGIAQCSPGASCYNTMLAPRYNGKGTVCQSGSLGERDGALYAALQQTANRTSGTVVPSFDTMAMFIGSQNPMYNDYDYDPQTNIEIVSSDCQAGLALQNYLATTTRYFTHFVDTNLDRGNPACQNLIWDDEGDAIDYVKGDGSGKTWAMIILNEVDVEQNVFDYTLRLNYTATPETKVTYDRFLVGLGNEDQTYISSGFATLQRCMNQYFTSLSVPAADSEAFGAQRVAGLLSFTMPTAAYYDSKFFTAAGKMIPIVLSLAYIYPVSRLVGGIVEEKEERLREGMLIMGLSKTSFYCSWFLTYFFLLTLSTVVITLAGAVSVFKNTSVVLIFCCFELFAMSIITLSMLISVFFSKARIAAIISPLVTFGMVVPKSFVADKPYDTKMLASLSSPVAFSEAISLFAEYERRNTGSSLADFFADDFSYANAFFMMAFDCVLYTLLALYLDNVVPSKYGVKQHPLFCFYPSYWGFGSGKYGHSERSADPPATVPRCIEERSEDHRNLREAVRIEGLRMEFAGPDWKAAKTVAVDNLGNAIPHASPGGKDALTFYQGQVQCVLGHNGAGKTTLINILTGMLQPTSGSCQIWGEPIATDMGRIREGIGLCPQHNILWKKLTCNEHLRFFGGLKGVPSGVLQTRIDQMLLLVNLFEKKDCPSEFLSGGQKRKLSVACALIGGSKLVFLDEPTAGMDVESRRAMWALLRNPAVLAGRSIVLTTHYMEEADILGDSIAIMHNGGLHSWGSSFYLKSRLGVGYNMSVTMQKDCDPAKVEDVVRRYITRADVVRTSCTGTELHLRIPMDSSPDHQFVADAESLINAPYAGNPSALREMLTQMLDGTYVVPGSEPLQIAEQQQPQQQQQQTVDADADHYLGLLGIDEEENAAGVGPEYANPNVPKVVTNLSQEEKLKARAVLANLRTVTCFPAMLGEMETRKGELRIDGFGVSVTTLEEVFLRIAAEADDEDTTTAAEPLGIGSTVPALENNTNTEDLLLDIEMAGVEEDDDDVTPLTVESPKQGGGGGIDFGSLYTITDPACPPQKGSSLFWRQFRGMFVKRAKCARRDKRTLIFQYAVPVVFILFAIWMASFGPGKLPSLELTPDSALGGADYGMPYSAEREDQPGEFSSFISQEMFSEWTLEEVAYGSGYVDLSQYLNDTLARKKSVHRQVAATFSEDLYGELRSGVPQESSAGVLGGAASYANMTTLLANVSYRHALPVGIGAVDEARLRVLSGHPKARVITTNHPLPFSNYEAKIVEAVQSFIAGVFIMIPFTFLPANFVSFVVKEKENKAKHVQVVSGAHIAAYWGSSFVFDFLSFCTTVVLVFIIFFAFGRTEFIGDAEVFFATFCLLGEYGLAAVGSSYAVSFIFTSHSQAQMAVSSMNFITGFVLVMLTTILDLIDSTKDASKVMKYIFRVVPSYCLGEGIIALSSRSLISTITDKVSPPGPFSMDVIGYDLIYLAITAPLFIVVVYLLESNKLRTLLNAPKVCAGGQLNEQLIPTLSTGPAFDPTEYATLPRDPPNVLYRRGAWLMCSAGENTPPYFFNEKTGESRYCDSDTPFHRDARVAAHEAEVLATDGPQRDGDFVTVKRLRKVFTQSRRNPKVAVADLSFGVEKGELFAFLGTNGAGKTTTLSMLSGEVQPSAGSAYIAGHDVAKDPHLARQHLGFCPQFDALLDHLTCEEHLDLFATLRGVPHAKVAPSKELLLTGLGLQQHRKKLAMSLSGGNKRKLSVALALMGGPSAIFLDEPSAGMDPMARRGLWGALEKAITDLRLSVILTTHHLEEIEGLGRLHHRVTIMVDGRLQCLGTLAQLKNQLGDTYEVTLKVTTSEEEASVKQAVGAKWPGAVLSECTQQRLTFQVPRLEANLPSMFAFVEDNREDLGMEIVKIKMEKNMKKCRCDRLFNQRDVPGAGVPAYQQ